MTSKHWVYVRGTVTIVAGFFACYSIIGAAGFVAMGAIVYLWGSMLFAEWRIKALEFELREQARRLREVRNWQFEHDPVAPPLGSRPH